MVLGFSLCNRRRSENRRAINTCHKKGLKIEFIQIKCKLNQPVGLGCLYYVLCIFHLFMITLLLPIITVITHYYMLPTGQLADGLASGSKDPKRVRCESPATCPRSPAVPIMQPIRRGQASGELMPFNQYAAESWQRAQPPPPPARPAAANEPTVGAKPGRNPNLVLETACQDL